MSKINRVPKGLQDLFGNTAAGVNPAELLQEVRPSIDLTALWSMEQTKWRAQPGTIAAVFQQVNLRVPKGEMWIPLTMSADVTTTVVGENIGIVIGVSDESNLIRCHLAESQPVVSTTALETSTASYTWASFQPLLPDQYVYVQCHRFNAAGGRTVGLDLKYIQLKI